MDIRTRFERVTHHNPALVFTCREVAHDLIKARVMSYSASKLLAVVEFKLRTTVGLYHEDGGPAFSIPHEIAPALIDELARIDPPVGRLLRPRSSASGRRRRGGVA